MYINVYKNVCRLGIIFFKIYRVHGSVKYNIGTEAAGSYTTVYRVIQCRVLYIVYYNTSFVTRNLSHMTYIIQTARRAFYGLYYIRV